MGVVGQLRPGQREPEPAGVRRADLAGAAARHRPAALLAAVGQRLPAVAATRACSSAPAAIPVLYLADPPGIDRDHAPPACSTALASSTSMQLASVSAIRRSRRASRSTRWRTACRPRVPELMDLSQGAGARLRAVRPGRAQAGHATPPTACWRGGWPSAACASSSSTTAAGTSTTTCRADLALPVQGHRPAVGGAGHGPEAARAARRHAGRLGRRVRPHGLLPGQADRDQLRPRPPSALLHHVDGRRRHQARHHARRDRRLLLQRRRGPGPRARPARDDPAPASASTTSG